MRHATGVALDRLDDLLRQVRRRHPELTERKRGIFYRGGQAWLHFHEDPEGLFADLKVAGAWSRLPINSAAGRKAVLKCLSETLAR